MDYVTQHRKVHHPSDMRKAVFLLGLKCGSSRMNHTTQPHLPRFHLRDLSCKPVSGGQSLVEGHIPIGYHHGYMPTYSRFSKAVKKSMNQPENVRFFHETRRFFKVFQTTETKGFFDSQIFFQGTEANDSRILNYLKSQNSWFLRNSKKHMTTLL